MIRLVNINGEQCPADFSIWTMAVLARAYDTDITGLGTLLSTKTQFDEQIELIANIGVTALNIGARRSGVNKTYTVYDLYDALTVDMSLSEAILQAFSEVFQGEEVFQKPAARERRKKGPAGE